MVHGSDQSEMFSGLVTNEICVVMYFLPSTLNPVSRHKDSTFMRQKSFFLNVLDLKNVE